MNSPNPKIFKSPFKVLVTFGTRPEAIKLVPVIEELRKRDNVEVVVVNTGQHQMLVDQVIDVFNLRLHYDLEIMQEGQTLSSLTSKLIGAITEVVQGERPDLIVIQGDTTTALVGGLVGFYEKVPIAHVEAGLRSFDHAHPFPEEFNRYVVDFISRWHFAPRQEDLDNLMAQGCAPERAFVVGNTVVDAILSILNSSEAKKRLSPEVKTFEVLATKQNLVLVTAHRRESFGEPLKKICQSVLTLAKKYPDVVFLVTVHPNPNVREAMHSYLADQANVILHPPFHYIDFIFIMSYCFCILTDSGGIQEEAPIFGKPVLVLRDKTERVAGTKVGGATVVGTDPEKIVRATEEYLLGKKDCSSLLTDEARFIYGDGRAAKRIVDILEQNCFPS